MARDVGDDTRSRSAGRVVLALLVAAAVGLLVLLVVVISTSDDDADSLDGSSWRLESLVVEGDEVPVVEGTSPTIDFVDGTVEGSGGCNTFFGDYEAGGDTIAIGPLAVTEIFCEEPIGAADQETAYLSRLTQASSFRIVDDRLVLSDDAGDSLRFGRA